MKNPLTFLWPKPLKFSKSPWLESKLLLFCQNDMFWFCCHWLLFHWLFQPLFIPQLFHWLLKGTKTTVSMTRIRQCRFLPRAALWLVLALFWRAVVLWAEATPVEANIPRISPRQVKMVTKVNLMLVVNRILFFTFYYCRVDTSQQYIVLTKRRLKPARLRETLSTSPGRFRRAKSVHPRARLGNPSPSRQPRSVSQP
jgi:hypothetical protein